MTMTSDSPHEPKSPFLFHFAYLPCVFLVLDSLGDAHTGDRQQPSCKIGMVEYDILYDLTWQVTNFGGH